MLLSAEVQAADLELVKPGSLLVAYNGDMPGTGVKDGKLIGLDGELMQIVGESLGLKVEPQLMEWAAEIESVKGRRVDAMHGMMGWNEARTKVINITDPPSAPMLSFVIDSHDHAVGFWSSAGFSRDRRVGRFVKNLV